MFSTIDASALLFVTPDTFNLGQVVVAKKWELIYTLERPVDYLVLGDSTANQGFDPAIVEEQLGYYGVNLGTLGTFGYVDDVWFLETYLELYGVPPLVIVIHSFDVPQRNLNLEEILTSYSTPLSVIHNQVQITNLEEVYDLLNVYQHDVLLEYFQNYDISSEVDMDNVEMAYHFNEYGFMTLEEYDEFVVEDDMFVFRRDIQSGALNGGFSQENRDAVNRMIALADELDFKLYFVNSPIYKDLQHSVGYNNIMAEITTQYEEMTATSSNAAYLPDKFPFTPDQMENLDHLKDVAADDYTIQIMNLVWDE